MFGGHWSARSQSLLERGLPTFHVVFQESNIQACNWEENCNKFRNMPPFLYGWIDHHMHIGTLLGRRHN